LTARFQVLSLVADRNEAARIEPVIAGAAAHLPDLMVDDDSHDQAAGA
jgi:hypothetical protein